MCAGEALGEGCLGTLRRALNSGQVHFLEMAKHTSCPQSLEATIGSGAWREGQIVCYLSVVTSCDDEA